MAVIAQALNANGKYWIVDLTSVALVERWPVDAVTSIDSGTAREATTDEINGAALLNELALKDAGAVTASGAGEVSAAAAIVHLAAETTGLLRIVVSAMDIASNDEIYDLILQGSPDAAFDTAANIVELQAINLSAKEVKRSDSDADNATGTYDKPFVNTGRNGTVYPYLRIYHAIAGTTPSINYTATLIT